MFTGIIEVKGFVKSIKKDNENMTMEIQSGISNLLKPDQSVSHNGACLTVTKKTRNSHFVTAVKETLEKTNLRLLKTGDVINLERSLIMGMRLDGHFVQGHIDHTSKVTKVINHNGSKEIVVELARADHGLIVEKGSVCLNGVSLTVSKLKKNSFSVVIIPYTLEHTNLKNVKKGSLLNVEFDIFGKYVQRIIRTEYIH